MFLVVIEVSQTSYKEKVVYSLVEINVRIAAIANNYYWDFYMF